MSTQTSTLQLIKPSEDDYYDITIQNENMDKIDAEFKNHSDHISDKSNPHSVTKSQVGLGNVDNTSDKNKPVSTATQTALDLKANITDLTSHTDNKSNPHNVTKSQVGLGNVPNVSTNDQTPTYSDTTTLSTLASGEKVSTAFGKIKLAITNLINHLANKSNPHEVTKEQVGLGNVPNLTTNDLAPTYTVASSNTDLSSGEKLSTAFGKIAKAISSLISHLSNKSNPHGVTKSQVGLGNVENLATNDTTPTYTEASSDTALVSGEKLSTAFGKISKAISSLISHLSNKSNPHEVTASQVGLGEVPNVSTNNQKPTYTVASSNTALSSGETLSTAFGKIAKAVSSLISHLADKSNPHGVTASQAGAVPTSETNKYNFTNKSINAVNIDEVFNYNYVVAISEAGHGTVPPSPTSWINVMNLYTDHFVTQLAFTCSSASTADRVVKLWIRERYMGASSVWSEWRLLYNGSTILTGTTDLVAGTTKLDTGSIYLVYE